MICWQIMVLLCTIVDLLFYEEGLDLDEDADIGRNG